MVSADADRARADAHAAWDELLDTLVDFRVPVDPTETPRATADRLVRDALDDDDAIGRRRGCSAGRRSGPGTRADPLTGERLLPALRAVRAALAARADRRTRLLAAVLPPSVLLRWRTAMATGPAGWWRSPGRPGTDCCGGTLDGCWPTGPLADRRFQIWGGGPTAAPPAELPPPRSCSIRQ